MVVEEIINKDLYIMKMRKEKRQSEIILKNLGKCCKRVGDMAIEKVKR